MRLVSISLAFALNVGATHAAPDAPFATDFVEIGQHFEFFQNVAAGGFAVTDVDGDGREDAVFVGEAASPLLLVLGKAGEGANQIKLSRRIPYDGFFIRTLVANVGGERRILTVSSQGTVRSYGGWPLTERTVLDIVPNVAWAQAGDVDGDGKDDLLVLTNQQLVRYDLESGLPTSAHPVDQHWEFTLAQLDSDPALEIILGGFQPGRVLDGATFATDWAYVDPFGRHIVAGRFADDQAVRWFGVLQDYTLFRAQPWSPLWTGTTFFQSRSAAAADIDGSGRDVLLLNTNYETLAIDPRTRQEIWTSGPLETERREVAGVDLDGDGADEIVSSSFAQRGDVLLWAAEGATGIANWSIRSAYGRLEATALGDLEEDGRIEMIAVFSEGSSQATVVVFDAESGRERWRNELEIAPSAPFKMSVHHLELIPRKGGAPGLDIALAGSAWDEGWQSERGRLLIVDGTTLTPGLIIEGDAALTGRRATALTMLDYDGDGQLDYALATEPLGTTSLGVKLFVYSGVDQRLLWQSPAINSPIATVRNLFAVMQEAANSELVVALDDGLRAFSVPGGQMMWTLIAPSENVAWAPDALSGPEFFLYSSFGAVTAFDYRTRTPLRSFWLPAPLRTLSALPGTSSLVAASSGRMSLIDGVDGTIRATTEILDTMDRPMSPPAVHPLSDTSWLIASGSDWAVTRLRVDFGDGVFRDGFD